MILVFIDSFRRLNEINHITRGKPPVGLWGSPLWGYGEAPMGLSKDFVQIQDDVFCKRNDHHSIPNIE